MTGTIGDYPSLSKRLTAILQDYQALEALCVLGSRFTKLWVITHIFLKLLPSTHKVAEIVLIQVLTMGIHLMRSGFNRETNITCLHVSEHRQTLGKGAPYLGGVVKKCEPCMQRAHARHVSLWGWRPSRPLTYGDGSQMIHVIMGILGES